MNIVTSHYLASLLSVWWEHHASLLYCDSLSASDDWGVGWERAAAGLLPRSEGGSQTHPADHTGHPAAGARTEGHQAHPGQGLLSPDWHGGTCSEVRPLMKMFSIVSECWRWQERVVHVQNTRSVWAILVAIVYVIVYFQDKTKQLFPESNCL